MFIIIVRRAMSATLPLLLAGCAGVPVNQNLTPEVRAQMRSTESYAVVSQSVLALAAGQADASAVSSLDSLAGFDFDTRLQERLQSSLRTVPGTGLRKVQLTKDATDENYAKLYRASTADTVLFVNAGYYLSVDFSSLHVDVRALMYPRQAPLLEQPLQSLEPADAIYRKSIVYVATLPRAAPAPVVNRDRWQSDDAALLRGALEQGIDEVAQALASDLRLNAVAKKNGNSQPQQIGALSGTLLLQRSNGVRHIQLADGQINIVPQVIPLPVPPVVASVAVAEPEVPAPAAPAVEPEPDVMAAAIAAAAAGIEADPCEPGTAASADAPPPPLPVPMYASREGAPDPWLLVMPPPPRSSLPRLRDEVTVQVQPDIRARVVAVLEPQSMVQLVRSERKTDGIWWYVKGVGVRGWVLVPYADAVQ